MASRGYSNAGISYRQCGDCNGAGALVLEHWSRDPQLVETLSCCNCAGAGLVRQTAVDPLETLQAERRSVLRMGREPADSLGAFLRPTAAAVYRRALARAMAPSPLPSDLAPASALERAA